MNAAREMTCIDADVNKRLIVLTDMENEPDA